VSLDHELLDGVLEVLDLALQLRPFVRGDRTRDDGSRNATGAPERLFRRHENIWYVLVLSQQRQMQEDLQRFSVGRHDDELGDAPVQGLGRCGSMRSGADQCMRVRYGNVMKEQSAMGGARRWRCQVEGEPKGMAATEITWVRDPRRLW